MRKKINVVIADDNIFLGQALAENLNNSKHLEITQVLDTIDNLIEFTSNNKLDILILDVNFNGKSSLDYIDKIRPERNQFKIIILTTLNNSYTKQQAIDKGIDLFKGKNAAYNNFDKVIIKCFDSNNDASLKDKPSPVLINNIKFTNTKIKVLKGLYHHSGKTEIEIAEVLNISTSSLKTHKRQLYEMTNTKRIVDLIKFGFDHGILIS